MAIKQELCACCCTGGAVPRPGAIPQACCSLAVQPAPPPLPAAATAAALARRGLAMQSTPPLPAPPVEAAAVARAAAAHDTGLVSIVGNASAAFEASGSNCLFPDAYPRVYLIYANASVQPLPLPSGETLPQEVLAAATASLLLVSWWRAAVSRGPVCTQDACTQHACRCAHLCTQGACRVRPFGQRHLHGAEQRWAVTHWQPSACSVPFLH